MPRRIVAGILVISLLAPGVAVPYSHAGTGVNEPIGHDQRPHSHFKLSWVYSLFFQGNEYEEDSHGHHGRRYDGGHPHHHNDDACHDHDDGMPLPKHQHDPLPAEDHDADAVYVDLIVGTTKLTHWSDNGLTSTSILSSHSQVLDAPFVPPMATPESLPPPTGRYACPIYLQTLTLLI